MPKPVYGMQKHRKVYKGDFFFFGGGDLCLKDLPNCP